jgi:phosphoribosyl 1,2-cyclic phosphodiesterase
LYVASLSSSSTRGNAYLAWCDSSRPVLIDCGISIRRLVCALNELGMEPRDLAGLFITHEHSDHISSMCLVTPVAQKFGIPVYSSPGFWEWYRRNTPCRLDPSLIKFISHEETARLEGSSVTAFSKPHDAAEPLGFVVEAGGERASFAMDLGHVPESVERLIEGSEYFVFESNHDVEMERNSGRPMYLIRRVLGDLGHLSNDQAADALSRMVSGCTKHVILSHLSLDCNTPEIALGVVSSNLARFGKICKVSAAPAGSLAVFGE